MENTNTENGRRDFIKKASLGGLSLGTMAMAPIEDQVEHVTSKINKNSNRRLFS